VWPNFLSRWYWRSELAFCLSIYIATGALSDACGGLLANAILSLDRFGSLRRWRILSAIEEMITVVIGLLSFVIMIDRPKTTRWLLGGKGTRDRSR
jgi:sugar phosphate permease